MAFFKYLSLQESHPRDVPPWRDGLHSKSSFAIITGKLSNANLVNMQFLQNKGYLTILQGRNKNVTMYKIMGGKETWHIEKNENARPHREVHQFPEKGFRPAHRPLERD